MTSVKNVRKGLISYAFCCLIWGFQPLYWNLCERFDTTFLMACRILWAAVTCLVILAVQRKLPLLRDTLRSWNVMKREIPASVFLLADWVVYLYAVRNGRVMECSLGYYIMPLVVFIFGALLFHEKINTGGLIAFTFIVVGIGFSFTGFGHAPWVTVVLSLCFAVYSALKKSLTTDSIVSTTCEILILVPFALVYILFFSNRETGTGAVNFATQMYLIGSGLVTGIPMVLFSIGVENLPLTAAGLFEYFSPTMSILCSVLMGERFTVTKLISFAFIWCGIIIYLSTSGMFRKQGKEGVS